MPGKNHKTGAFAAIMLLAAGAAAIIAVLALSLWPTTSGKPGSPRPGPSPSSGAPRTDARAPAPRSGPDAGTTRPAPLRPPAPPDPVLARIAALRKEAAEKMRAGNVVAALELMDRARGLSPDDPQVKRELSHLYALRGWRTFDAKDFDKARGFFEEALYYWPDSEEAARGMGFARFEERDRAGAEQWLKTYVGLGGGRPDAYNLLGRICYESGRPDQALGYFENSLALSPEQPAISELAAKIRREIKVEAGFFESDSSHFTIKYEGKEVPDASRVVMVICEEAYFSVGRRLGCYPDAPVPVILYTDEQFQDVTRSPAWAGAIFDAKIRIPAKGLRQRTDVLERIIFHEYAHAVVHDVSRGRAPLWLHEGLAQMSEEQPIDAAALAARVTAAGGPIPLQKLEGSFLGLPKAQAETAYAESLLAVQYLCDHYGPYAVRELLRGLKEGDNIGGAIKGLTARDYAVFDREFQDWVRATAENR
ncbi:MAG TPA: tetratricopeptide repeat protein [bacterium]|nr:tetratricopeptide repeat protein [bacterium]